MRASREKRAQAMTGEQFKTTRLALGLKQAQLAAVLGLSTPSVISDMEVGRKRVPDYLARHVLTLVVLGETRAELKEARAELALVAASEARAERRTR